MCSFVSRHSLRSSAGNFGQAVALMKFYSGVTDFRISAETLIILADDAGACIQSLQACVGIVLPIRPRPLPFALFLIQLSSYNLDLYCYLL
jgi:hypothetical protein